MWRHCVRMSNAVGAAGGNNRGANLGHLVNQKAEMNINLAAYYLHYSEMISQACQPVDLLVQAIYTIRELCDSDGNWHVPNGQRLSMELMNSSASVMG